MKTKGHLLALFTIMVWGTTYVSIKVLLRDFSAVEIIILRFIAGYIALWVACPHMLHSKGWAQEKYFAAAGICGVTLYFLLQNEALVYTQASNAGVIISVAPFFTALFVRIIYKDKSSMTMLFFTGFVLSMIGVALLNFSSVHDLKLSPAGDLMALGSAIVWAAYSVIMKKVSGFGYTTLQATRRVFFYGLLFMLPCLPFSSFGITLGELAKPLNFGNILFLGIGASAICFVTWNYALKVLGAVKTSVYIYLVPVITVITSVVILGEKVTIASFIGILLTVSGLVISSIRRDAGCC